MLMILPMKLLAYLTKEGLTRAEFARQSGISEATVSLLCRGETWLSRDMARRLFRATGGAVTPTDLLELERAD